MYTICTTLGSMWAGQLLKYYFAIHQHKGIRPTCIQVHMLRYII